MDILTTVKSKGYEVAHFCYKHRAKIAFVGGGLALTLGVRQMINDVEKIAAVNKVVKDDKEVIKKLDEEKGWSECNEKRWHYVMRTGINHAWMYTRAAGKGVACIAVGYGLCGYAFKTTNDDYKAEALKAAMYASTLASYRANVRKDLGAAKDLEYLTGEKMVTVTTDEEGNVTTVEQDLNPDHLHIPHSFIFEESNRFWTKNPEYNLETVYDWEREINRQLQLKRFLTENDMRDICKTSRTKVGNTSGVRFKNKDGSTNIVQFNREAMKSLIEGNEASALLIFEYDDGRQIESNIMTDINWETGL